MTYEAPELFELGQVEDLTFGGIGCSTDHETMDGEDESLESLRPPFVAEE
jgi:hypothetical protein